MKNNYALTLSDKECKNCYKCIRSCPVKAICFRENKTQISSQRCIACGNCFNLNSASEFKKSFRLPFLFSL